MSESMVGNAAARGLRGLSAGADCVLLGQNPAGSDRWTATLSEVCEPAVIQHAGSLQELAEFAAAGGGPLVVADVALDLELPGTLDVLDSPTDLTAVLVAEPRNIEAPRQPEHGLERATPARADADGQLVAVGLDGQPLPGADRVVLGLLRVNATDRMRATELWRQAAERESGREAEPPAEPGSVLFDRAVAVLAADGHGVRARSLGYYTWSRADAGQTGIGRSAWQQRLRSASRLGDGAYSAAVVRPLSRIGTRLGLRIGITPNVVTMISLAVGVLSGLLILTGSYPLWILAAILLQLALVIDCMDGEIARFTRRFSAFGGWLDGIGDRVKEYLVLAAVATVAAQQGHSSGWLLAMTAMVIVTGRHLEDYAYGDRTAAIRAASPPTPAPPVPEPRDASEVPEPRDASGAPELRDASGVPELRDAPELGEVPEPVEGHGDHGQVGTPSTGSGPGAVPAGNGLRSPASRKQRMVFWAKKIAHVPIAERYLILSLGLLTGRPIWVLVAAVAVSAFALVWAVGGRLLRAVRTPRPPANPTLGEQLDLGRLARLVGWQPIGYLPGLALLIICWLACILGICTRWWPVSLVAAIAAVLLAGCALRDPSRHRSGWLALPVVWAVEAAVIGSLLSWSLPGVLLFCVLAAIAYRRYELIYSIRLRGLSGPAAIVGFDGRILLLVVLVSIAALLGSSGQAVLEVGLLLLGSETLAEAVVGTVRRWRRTPDAAV